MLQVDVDKIIPVTEARDNFNKIVEDVDNSDQMYVLTRNGTPVAVVVGVNHLEKLTGAAMSDAAGQVSTGDDKVDNTEEAPPKESKPDMVSTLGNGGGLDQTFGSTPVVTDSPHPIQNDLPATPSPVVKDDPLDDLDDLSPAATPASTDEFQPNDDAQNSTLPEATTAVDDIATPDEPAALPAAETPVDDLFSDFDDSPPASVATNNQPKSIFDDSNLTVEPANTEIVAEPPASESAPTELPTAGAKAWDYQPPAPADLPASKPITQTPDTQPSTPNDPPPTTDTPAITFDQFIGPADQKPAAPEFDDSVNVTPQTTVAPTPAPAQPAPQPTNDPKPKANHPNYDFS